MLYIYFKQQDDFDTILTEENYRICPTLWFNHQGGEDYLAGALEQQIIKDIDSATQIADNVFLNEETGAFTAECLSGTSKTLILANNEPGIFVNGDFIGDNGCKWLLKIAETKDVYLRVGYLMPFHQDFQAHIINDNSSISAWADFVDKGVYFLHGGNA